MAIQLWQQILLSDRDNAQALAGLARDYKLVGSADKSAAALDRLRQVNPADPNIAKIAGLSSTRAESDQLRQAGELARQGKPEEAMRIYRDLYGDHPPDGDVALAYYQTLYGTAKGKMAAISAMRAMARRNPGDTRIAIALGTMLTYDARTRDEGMRILQSHSKDTDAGSALRQALVWDENNPASVPLLREYLKDHPQDTELAAFLKENEAKLAKMNSGIARTPAEIAAFAALNAHQLSLAQTRFLSILAREPKNGRAAAGMGFLRMQQNNFAGAISYLTQAEEYGYNARVVADALATSRFWFTMGEAAQAVDDNQLDVATAKYQAALLMQPRSQDALQGLAGLLIKEQQYAKAAGVYEQLIRVQSDSAEGWRGLFLAYARDGQSQKALTITDRFPAVVKTSLAKDPEFLRALASVYRALNRPEEVRRTLVLALSLPYPDNGAGLSVETRLQYAGILVDAKRFDQAAQMYGQILNDDAGNLSAWSGLIGAYHEIHRDSEAIAEVEKMPTATYEAALADPGFLSILAAAYQQTNQLEIAQQLLERSAKIQIALSGQPSLQLQVQLAGIYLARNNTAQAYDLYRQLLTGHPDRGDAWKGLIATLQATNRNTEAFQEIAQIPPQVRKQLELDIDFVQSEAALYAATGDTTRAVEYMNRVEAHYSALKIQLPTATEIQNAWLLYDTKNDRALYPVLMNLGARADLTATQRETVQLIWANWSVRRAETAMDNGNAVRAASILEAAAMAFPDNLDVRKAVAGGYAKVGRGREAMALYQSIPLENASSTDLQGAVGAALAANDKAQAETWLRQALARFPRDPGILQLAARFEEARGDKQRAAEYLRSSLAAMPPVSPTDRLAHQLAYPDYDGKAHRPTTPADLERLLNPESEPFQKTLKLPPLPAYGVDPYTGSAPVVLNPSQQLPQRKPWIDAPATTTTTPEYKPEAATVPKVQAAPLDGLPSALRITGKEPLAAPSSFDEPSTQDSTNYMGRIHLPVVKNGAASTLPAAPKAGLQVRPQSNSWKSPVTISSSDSKPAGGMRITSQPMNATAAQAQALFAEQTDGQLTQGSATIHTLAVAMVTPTPSQGDDSGSGQYEMAQYTPSVQEATTGAYSAPQQPAASQSHPVSQSAVKTAAKPSIAKSKKKKKSTKSLSAASSKKTVPTLATAPSNSSQESSETIELPSAPVPTASSATTTGATDEELQQSNLPPLRGPWGRIQRQKQTVVSPRDEAELQLHSIESGYSGWLGGSGTINYRSGDLGYDHLSALEAPFELSTPLGVTGRFTIVAKPVFLDSGQADGTSVLSIQQQTTAGTTIKSLPQPIGTLTATDVTPPAQQNATGIGGEAQLAFKNFGLAGGYTPHGFLVATYTGRLQWKPGNGPFTFSASRDSVKDTQLSYAGLRDPAGTTLGNQGQIWGGVVADQGNVQFSHGGAESGFYLGADGQYLSGYNVQTNTRIEGLGGAYWRVMTQPEYGTLTIGANFLGMHYAHNQDAFTHGMGGYFSPQAYFLANAPFTWTGHSGTAWHYNIKGSLGIQAFQTDLTPLWPLAVDKALEISMDSAALPAKTSVGPNYDLNAQAAYQINSHWFVGGFLSANNTRNYSTVSASFSIRYLFREQPSTVAGPTGLFPSDGLRPYVVP
jgi:tetratricopeptide (TPR) repeat protein